MFTPQTPHAVKITMWLTVLLLPWSTILLAQKTNTSANTINLDSVSIYEASYRLFMVQQWKANRSEFTVTTRKKWWYYLPSVGYSLRSPLVQMNTGVLTQIDRDKLTMAARLESIDARYQVEFTETLARIRIEYRKLLVRSEQIERERATLAKLRGIMAIHTDAFNAQTMPPEEHLRHAYNHENAINQFRAKESDLVLAALDFFALCRYQMPETRLIDVAQIDCPATERSEFSLTVVADVAVRQE